MTDRCLLPNRLHPSLGCHLDKGHAPPCSVGVRTEMFDDLPLAKRLGEIVAEAWEDRERSLRARESAEAREQAALALGRQLRSDLFSLAVTKALRCEVEQYKKKPWRCLELATKTFTWTERKLWVCEEHAWYGPQQALLAGVSLVRSRDCVQNEVVLRHWPEIKLWLAEREG